MATTKRTAKKVRNLQLEVRALRYQRLLLLMCGAKPPLDMCRDWINSASQELQNWVGLQHKTPSWLQNIGLLDGVDVMCDSPIEGEVDCHDPAYSLLKERQ